MKTATVEILSNQDSEDYKKYIQKKHASSSMQEKTKIIDEYIDIITYHQENLEESYYNIEEIELIKLEAQTLAEMKLRSQKYLKSKI